MSHEYDLYLTQHIENVQKGWDWMRTNLLNQPGFQEFFEKNYPDGDLGFIDIFKIDELAEHHDRSKYEAEEYRPYDAYFYGPPSTRGSFETVNNFNEAFLKHIHKNPHHWQYWVLVHDDAKEGTEVLEMPVVYIFEMICDWWTFSWKANDLFEIFQWYADHKKHILLAKKTKKTVEFILGEMQKVLEKDEEHLEHHGILGMKWGVRRFQNPDGTRTPLGKKLRNDHTVFISGSSKTQDEGGEYYRKELPKGIKNEIDRHMTEGHKIIVGDAPGIDRQVQDYLNEQDYDNVEIYGPGTQVRYSANVNWKTNPIDAPEYEPGSKEWLAKKDKAMSDAADEGLAVILPYGSRATRKNAERLIEANKDVKLFELQKNGNDAFIDADVKEYLELISYELGETINPYKDYKELKHSNISEDEHKYGVPEQKKFPMPDADHVHSAIKFFNYVDPEHEKELAQAILKRAKEYSVDISEISIGDENRFKKYVEDKE